MPDEEDDRPIGHKIEADLNDAISDVMSKYEANFVTKWVTVLEAVDSEGERSIWTFTSFGAKAWEITGLQQSSIDHQRAHEIVDVLQEHGFGN